MACLLLVLLIGLAVGGSAGLLGGAMARITLVSPVPNTPTIKNDRIEVGKVINSSARAWYARMVRNLVVSLRQREFILAARLSGASQWRLFPSATAQWRGSRWSARYPTPPP
jgi:nickel transport system permease protein